MLSAQNGDNQPFDFLIFDFRFSIGKNCPRMSSARQRAAFNRKSKIKNLK
jgi:hypothetical protein